MFRPWAVLAYLPKNVTVGSTPFVTRPLNLAAIDPGGSVGFREHLRPVRGSKLSGRRFGLWPLPLPKLAYFRPFRGLEPRRNRSGVVELVGKELFTSFGGAVYE